MKIFRLALVLYTQITVSLAIADPAPQAPQPTPYFSIRQASNEFDALQRFKSLKIKPAQLYLTRDRAGDEWIADRRLLLDSKYISSAKVVKANQENSSADTLIQVLLTDEGKEKFAEITQTLLNRQVAFFIDGELVGGVFIRGVIKGGTFQVNIPNATDAELQSIAEKITSSARP